MLYLKVLFLVILSIEYLFIHGFQFIDASWPGLIRNKHEFCTLLCQSQTRYHNNSVVFVCGGLMVRICYIVLSNVFLIVPYFKNLAYSHCPVYCTKVVLVWICLANRWGSSKIVSWCGSCVYHKWQDVKECIARRKLSWNWGFCRKNSRKCLAYLAVTTWILLESTCTAARPLKLRTHKTNVDRDLIIMPIVPGFLVVGIIAWWGC